MTLKSALKPVMVAVVFLSFGAASFFVGKIVGATSMEVVLILDGDESIDGRLAILETSKWDGLEVATAICATNSDLDNFANTYALFGTGIHYVFSCDEPGKDT